MRAPLDGRRRAELERLRRRAYGPDADIDGDPEAVARLAALEDAARLERAGAIGLAAPRPPADGPGPSSRSRIRRLAGGAAVGVAIVAVVSAIVLTLPVLSPPTQEAAVDAATSPTTTASPAASTTPDVAAFGFAYGPDAVPLLRVPLDGSFGDHVDLPMPSEIPVIGGRQDLEWAEPLGDYYGWALWIARTVSGDACLAVEDGVDVRSRCVGDAGFENGQLMVTVPFGAIREDERPTVMSTADSIGYWWAGNAVLIVLGRTDDAPDAE